MNVYEKARDLAESILNENVSKKFIELKYILDGDTEAKDKLNLYTALSKDLKLNKNLSRDEFTKKTENIKNLENDIKNDKLISDYFKAEQEFTIFVNSVMDIFNATLFGEIEEDNKSANCCKSGCGGCSGC